MSENAAINLVFLLVIFGIFLILKKIAWSRTYTWDTVYQVGWVTLLYNDMYSFILKRELRRLRSIYKPLDKNVSYIRMILYSLFQITMKDVLFRCGVDAVQYLQFHHCIWKLMVFNAILCIFVVLPANFHGNMQKEAGAFERSTLDNIQKNSSLLWVHLLASLILLIGFWVTIKDISDTLFLFHEDKKVRKTFVFQLRDRKNISSETMEMYIRKHYPLEEIEDIKLVYKYGRIIRLSRKLKRAKDTLEICEHIENREKRLVILKPSKSWFCLKNWFSKTPTEPENAHDYYLKEVKSYEEAIQKEMNWLPRRVLPIAFVTFRRPTIVHQLKDSDYHYNQEKVERKWNCHKAEHPRYIIWENLHSRLVSINMKSILINTAVFLLAFFLTTPKIIIGIFKIKQMAVENFLGKNLYRYLNTFGVWTLSTSIAAGVTYFSPLILEYKTLSSMYKSTMKKTVIFLVFTIVILPSLDSNSLYDFTTMILRGVDDFTWNCLFLPDNGAFFVDYVLTSACIGTAFQLLRISDLIYYAFFILRARSEAERVSIRKDFPWSYSFGVQYSTSLLIFTVVIFFSIPCPAISICGLVYFSLRYLVDRYNIYFAYAPSNVGVGLHVLAIKFMILAVMLQYCGFFYMLVMREEWSPVTYIAHIVMYANIIVCFTTINPLDWEDVPPFWVVRFDTLTSYSDRFRESVDELQNSENEDEHMSSEEVVYQAPELQEIIGKIPHVDKYKNPVRFVSQ